MICQVIKLIYKYAIIYDILKVFSAEIGIKDPTSELD